MIPIRYCIALVLILAVVPYAAHAGGFQINEHGTKAMGMGGAFSAQASDGSAMYYNPAGLGFQQGFKVLAGATLIMPLSSYTSLSGTTTDMESQVFFPPHAYVSYGDPSGWTFGIGFYAPFGLGTEWPPDWTGRYSAVKADLQSFYINPTVAYKFSEQFSLGVGGSYVFSDVELSQRVPTSTTAPSPSTDGDLRLKADATAFNFNAGLLFKPSTQWSIGVSYRHSTELKYEGDATFSNMGALGIFFPGGPGKTEITFPNNIFAGVAYQATDKLIIEADFQYIMWSTYDTLKIVMPVGPSTPPPPLGTGQPLQGPQALPKDWDDAWMIRIGGEYQLETVALCGTSPSRCEQDRVHDRSRTPDL